MAHRRARGQDDLRSRRSNAHHEYRLADGRRKRRRAGAAAEVHAHVAMRMLVRAIGEPVRRIHRGTGDQHAGRHEGEQVIAAETGSQVR